VVRWAFVTTVGRLPDVSLAFDKIACWIRFSKWCLATGAKVSKFDASEKEEGKRVEMYERVIGKESLDRKSLYYLEFGVHRGVSFLWWAARCNHPENRFVGFDTFWGLPDDWSRTSKKGKFSTKGQIPETDDPRCRFEAGLFQDTLSKFLSSFNRKGTTLVVHLDADLYSSTLYVLASLAPFIQPGDLLFFDEFCSTMHEFRALDDFVKAFRLEYQIIEANNNFEQVCLRVTNS
jgi:hypothetical protein